MMSSSKRIPEPSGGSNTRRNLDGNATAALPTTSRQESFTATNPAASVASSSVAAAPRSESFTTRRASHISLSNVKWYSERSVDLDSSENENHVNSGSSTGQASNIELAQRETRAVNRLRTILAVVLVTTATLVAVFVYIFTSHSERNGFQSTFDSYSHLIEDKVQTNARGRLEAIGALAASIQAYALNTDSKWPFVTMPFFEDRVTSMQSVLDAYGILLFPIVKDENRTAWEEYSVNHSDWVNTSFAVQEDYFGTNDQEFLDEPGETWFDVLWGEGYEHPDNPDFTNGISNQIFRTSQNQTGNRPLQIYEKSQWYFPQWQVAPISWYYQSTINSNYGQWDDFYNSTVISMETGHAVLGMAWTDSNAPGYISTMLYPIFDHFPYQHRIDDIDNREVVAFIGADIFWEDYLKEILPDDGKGIYVVIENTLGQIFTYRLDGEKVTFVGDGAKHDKEYDDWAHTTQFGIHLHQNVSNEFYVGAPLHDEFIQYTLHIYPSDELKKEFVTVRPIIYTVIATLIFMCTSAVFVTYESTVERRQKLVMTTAIKSDAIVSSLFPQRVKERLYNPGAELTNRSGEFGSQPFSDYMEGASTSVSAQDLKKNQEAIPGSDHYDDDDSDDDIYKGNYEEGKVSPSVDAAGRDGDETGSHSEGAAAAEHLPWFGHGISTGTEKTHNGRKGSYSNPLLAGSISQDGPPIAEHYDISTVFFADLVGFTAWSSDRSAVDVFMLLESLYGAFDAIAHKRGVFKVETIGDCYVAVTGVPVPRDDHAVVMVRFASEMLQTLQVELVKLTKILGNETLDLAMRVGIHSGPVTAGVLRGEKARFQLFGDTMNTAARMESTSQPSRIQLTEATARLLLKAGKVAWIRKREETISVKGKGEMQTYWVVSSRSHFRKGTKENSCSSNTNNVIIINNDDDDDGDEDDDDNDINKSGEEINVDDGVGEEGNVMNEANDGDIKIDESACQDVSDLFNYNQPDFHHHLHNNKEMMTQQDDRIDEDTATKLTTATATITVTGFRPASKLVIQSTHDPLRMN